MSESTHTHGGSTSVLGNTTPLRRMEQSVQGTNNKHKEQTPSSHSSVRLCGQVLPTIIGRSDSLRPRLPSPPLVFPPQVCLPPPPHPPSPTARRVAFGRDAFVMHKVHCILFPPLRPTGPRTANLIRRPPASIARLLCCMNQQERFQILTDAKNLP